MKIQYHTLQLLQVLEDRPPQDHFISLEATVWLVHEQVEISIAAYW